MSSQDDSSRGPESRKFSFFFPRRKTASQPPSPEDLESEFMVNGTTRKRNTSQSMPVATNAYYQPKAGSVLKSRTVTMPEDLTKKSNIDENLRSVIKNMIWEEGESLISQSLSDITERLAKLEEEMKRSNQSNSYKLTDLKFRMTIIEEKLTPSSVTDIISSVSDTETLLGEEYTSNTTTEDATTTQGSDKHSRFVTSVSAKEPHGYVDAMDKMILKEVMASPNKTLQQKKQTILKVVVGPSETINNSSNNGADKPNEVQQSKSPSLPPPPPSSSLRSSSSSSQPHRPAPNKKANRSHISFADDFPSISSSLLSQDNAQVDDAQVDELGKMSLQVAESEGVETGPLAKQELETSNDNEEEEEEESTLSTEDSSSQKKGGKAIRSVDLFLRPDATFMDVAMRPRARSKRFSRNTLINFMKVMRRGVLPKVLVGELVDAAAEVEPSITSLLSDIAAKSNGELVGLEYKFKTTESLLSKTHRNINNANLKILEDMERRRKLAGSNATKAYLSGEKKQRKIIAQSESMMKMKRHSSNQELLELLVDSHKQSDIVAAKSAEKIRKAAEEIEAQAEKEGRNEVDIPTIVWNISDALRYTVIIETDRYTQCVKDALTRLQGSGMQAESLKNYWGPGDGYQGINDVFSVACDESPTGKLKFEVQFHTPESFKHKMSTHGLYEEFRSTPDPVRKLALFQESVAQADAIPVPLRVLELPQIKTQAMPIEATLYADLVIARALKIQQPALEAIRFVMKNLKLPSYMEVSKVDALITTQIASRQTIEFKMNSERVNAEKKYLLSGASSNQLNLRDDSSVSDGSSNKEMTLKDAALKINDALVVNVVLDSDIYATAIELAMVQLFEPEEALTTNQLSRTAAHLYSTKSMKSGGDTVTEVGAGEVGEVGDGGTEGGNCGKSKKQGFMKEVKTSNGWSTPMLFRRTGASGGIGVYCYVTMEGEDDGVAFTPDDAYPLVIAFHTQESLTARTGLQSAWSDYRVANTRKQRDNAVLKAQRLALNVSVPIGARRVRGPKWHSKEFVSPMDAEEESDSDSEE